MTVMGDLDQGYDDIMRKERCHIEEIVPMRRDPEVEIGKGLSVREVCRKFQIHEHTYYHWRRGNSRLKRVVAELTLDKQILTEAVRGKPYALRLVGMPRSLSDVHWARRPSDSFSDLDVRHIPKYVVYHMSKVY